MRGGPELRITGTVTTVTPDTSVEITQDREDSQEKDTQSAARVITITDTDTIDAATLERWAVGERVEVVIKALGGV